MENQSGGVLSARPVGCVVLDSLYGSNKPLALM
jgi:hypothetical protein